METSQFAQLVSKVIAQDAIETSKRATAEYERMVNYKAQLETWNSKVREWLENINLLRQNGFPLYSPADWLHKSKPYEQRERMDALTLCTDGIYHDFGYFPHFGVLGVAQGGANGDWHILTNGSQWWLQHGSQTMELRERDYNDLFRKYSDSGLNRLERFEHKMNNLYAYMEKR